MLKQGMVAFCALAFVGCGGGDPLSADDAKLAFEATSGVTSGGAPNALTVSAPCQKSGKVKWKSNLFGGLTEVSENNIGFEQELVFRGCQNDNIKISGKLIWDLQYVNRDGTQVSRFGYRGKLRYAGDINGTCEYDMYWEARTDTTSASVTYGGTLCGHEAHTTITAGADNASIEISDEETI